ncbi:MAG: hypothetical protein HRU19_24325 [Pseudobacteriovorax sp.]|nr:hypothetical protein [Pseudobacteriovorax sp.]
MSRLIVVSVLLLLISNAHAQSDTPSNPNSETKPAEPSDTPPEPTGALTPAEEAEVMGADSQDASGEPAEDPGDDSLLLAVEDEEPDLVDMNISLTRRWFDDAPLTMEGVQFTTEWSVPGLPIRFGPSIRYATVIMHPKEFEDGQLIDFGIRLTTFMDFEHFLPYLSVDYTFGGSGSVRTKYREGNVEDSGTLNLTAKGYDVVLGTSFFIGSIGLFLETAITSKHDIDFEGTITRATTGDDGQITFTDISPTDYDGDTVKSIAFGLSIEL